VIYTEVTLSIGVMLLRKQRPEANFEALLRATEPFESRGLRFNWYLMPLGNLAWTQRWKSSNPLSAAIRKPSWPSASARRAERSDKGIPPRLRSRRANGSAPIDARGEVGGPDKIREAIELLGAERIGHGIAAIHDPELMDLLAERKIPLEMCPASNMKTAALARQLHREDARIEDHPLPKLLRHGIPIVLSTDDPAMFHTTLDEEYVNAARMGLSEEN